MRILAAIQGDLNVLLQAELRTAEHAVTAGVRAATDGLKTELRRQITGVGRCRNWCWQHGRDERQPKRSA